MKTILTLLIGISLICLIAGSVNAQSFVSNFTYLNKEVNLSNFIPDGINTTSIFYIFSEGTEGTDYLYISTSNNIIHQFNISNFDLDTLSYNNVSLDVSAVVGTGNNNAVTGLYVHGLGNNLYLSSINGNIYRYGLSDSFNLSSASFLESSGSLADKPKDIWLRPNGLELLILDSDSACASSPFNSNLLRYELSNPFDLSTAILSQTGSIPAQLTCVSAQDIWVDSSGSDFRISYSASGISNPPNSQFLTFDWDVSVYDLTPNSSFSDLELASWFFNTNPHNIGLFLENTNQFITDTILRVGRGEIIKMYASTPSITSELDDEVMGFEHTLIFDFDNYFENYIYPTISINNLNTGEIAQLELTETHSFSKLGFPSLFVNFSSVSDILFTSFNQNDDYEFTFYACNGINLTSCVFQTATLEINESSFLENNLQQIGNMIDYAQALNTSKIVYNVNDYFLNYGYLEIQQGQATITEGQNTTSSLFSVALSANGSLQTTSFSVSGIFPISVVACVDDTEAECLTDSFNVFVNSNGSLPSQPDQPQGSGESVNFIVSLFPDSSSLSLTEKMVYVFIFAIATFIFVLVMTLFIGYLLGSSFNIAPVLWISLILIAIEFVFFISIGYIPVGILIVLALLIATLGYFKFKGGSGTNG